MAGNSQEIQAAIAFKLSQGKGHTDVNKAVGNEAEGILINQPASASWFTPINASASVAVADGVAFEVTADLVADLTSNGHAYFAVWPNPLPPNAPADAVAGGRVRNAIPPSFGVDYEASPVDVNDDIISVNDTRLWIYGYNNGVFYQETLNGLTPSKITVFVFTGETTEAAIARGLLQFENAIKSEFYESVATQQNDPPATPSEGDRYLIGTLGTGDWSGHDNKIAEYKNGQWSLFIPTNGSSVKLDNDDSAVYHYDGNYPTGSWLRQVLSAVRAGVATGTDDYIFATSPSFPSLLKDQPFILSFQNANTGAVSLNVNALGSTAIQKDDGTGALVELEAGDIKLGIIYMLLFNGTVFQLFISGVSGDIELGAPVGGSYSEGLYDYQPETLLGQFAYDVNIFMKATSPPQPSILNMSSFISASAVSAKLSFDSTNPVAGGSYTGANLAGANAVSIDGTWSAISNSRLGVMQSGATITGVLNESVAASGVNYVANSIKDFDRGTLSLELNGQIVSTMDLASSTGALSNIVDNAGFSASAVSNVKFDSGQDFPASKYRTCTWTIRANHAFARDGYNTIEIKHDIGSGPVRTVGILDFVRDSDANALSIGAQTFDTLVMSGAKYLSGIAYHTGGTAQYNGTVSNVYRNVYSTSSAAVSFDTTRGSIASQSLPASSGDELKVLTVAGVFNISNDQVILDSNISTELNVIHPLKGTFVSATLSIGGILHDDLTETSTLSVENFRDERYRLPNDVNTDSPAALINGLWDSQESLVDGLLNHRNSLQVINQSLIYPGKHTYPADFRTSSIINGPVFNDGGTKGGARNYTALSGNKTYSRYVQKVSPTTANFRIRVDGDGAVNFVPTTTALVGNNAHLEIKAPGETGWLDAYQDFSTGQYGDGAGARNLAEGSGGINSNLGLTIGIKNTANTDGKMIYRITLSDSFAAKITSITFTFI